MRPTTKQETTSNKPDFRHCLPIAFQDFLPGIDIPKREPAFSTKRPLILGGAILSRQNLLKH